MKAVLSIVVLLFAVASCADDICYNDARRACKPSTSKLVPTSLQNCNAKYGAITELNTDLQEYARAHLAKSFEYLLMSTHYASYEKNRAGFEKLFRDLSDKKWHDAIDLIKYMTKRGGEMKFDVGNQVGETTEMKNELFELESLAKALDIEKALAIEAHNIHGDATRRRKDYHDPEISSYLEKEFLHRQADTVRTLSGYASDLTQLLNGTDSSLGLYLFDEYLQKQ